MIDVVELTERVTLAHLGSPAAHQVYFIFRHGSHARVPLPNELDILFDLVWLDFMEHDAMHVLATCKDLGERAFDVAVLRRRISIPGVDTASHSCQTSRQCLPSVDPPPCRRSAS